MDLMTNTNFKRKLPVPQEIKKEMPLTKEAEEIKAKRDEEIAKVIQKDFLSSSLDEIKTILKNYKTIKAYAENQKISKEEFEKLVSIIKMAGELEEDYIPPFEKLVTDKYL